MEFESDTGTLFEFVSDASRLPSWASAFAPKIRRISAEEWEVERGAERFRLRVVADKERGTIDFLRQVAPGAVGGAFLRVVPRPGGGSVLTMIAPIPDGSTIEAVDQIVRSELLAVRRLLDGG